MKKIGMGVGSFLLLFVFFTHGSVAAEKSLVYDSYANESTQGKVLYETAVMYKDLPDQQTAVSRKKQTTESTISDEFILDKDYDLVKWQRVCAEERSNYVVKREGDVLVVTGTFKGQPLKKKITLEGKEVHIYPNYSLGKFALSGNKNMNFWSLRRDQLTKIPMKARNDGEETILVNGKRVEAIKIYYTIEGKLREKHYNHTYYYRKSDGLYIKKKESKGEIEELVKED